MDHRSKSRSSRKKQISESEPEGTRIPKNYMKVLNPIIWEKRVQFNLNIPWSLTPKGYTKLQRKLTSPNILHPMRRSGSAAFHVYKKLFTDRNSEIISGNDTSYSENGNIYPSPTRMRSFKGTEYETIMCRMLETKELYEDPCFPANDDSIGNIPDLLGKVEWKRPKDINHDAQFYTNTLSRFDVDQGALGDCWFNAALATITKYPTLLNQVIPLNQVLKGSGYRGVIVYRFWRFGQWIDVVIDDRLPVYKGTNELVFMHSSDKKEFWSSLLEKAYAKLCGKYEHLNGGFQSEAMEDLTGGICQTVILNEKYRPMDLLKMMKVYSETCCLIGCDVDSERIKKREQLGLINSHAYSVTGFGKVQYHGKEQYLVRCRNPWGEKHEWTGAWSDKSDDWKHVKPKDKKTLQFKSKPDGEFWMSFEDFEKYFSLLEVCHLGLSSLDYDDEIRGSKRLEEIFFSGEWQTNFNAGGSINYPDSYFTNPQYMFTIGADSVKNEPRTLIIVGLMQEERRRKYGADFLSIGFAIYEVSPRQNTRLTAEQLSCRKPLTTTQYIARREVTLEDRLFPGTFILIPTTYDPGQEGKFIVRIFSPVKMKQLELDDTNTYQGFSKETIEALERTILIELQTAEYKFGQVCNPETQTIDAAKLGYILNHSDLKDDIHHFIGFNDSLCRSLLPSVSTNLTGQIDLEEFLLLWAEIKTWKYIFQKYEHERKGIVRAYSFREMLNSTGYHVSNRVYHVLSHRYIDSKNSCIHFEDFLYCLANMKSAYDNITVHPTNSKGQLIFTPEDFLRLSLST